MQHVHRSANITETDMPHILRRKCECGLEKYYAEDYWNSKKAEEFRKKANKLNRQAEAEWRKNRPLRR